MKKIIDASPDWLRPMILTAYYTGLREGELLGLRWEWIDLKDGVLYLPSTKTLKNPTGKGQKVVMQRELTDLLENLPKRSELVFCQHDGEPYKQWHIHKPFKRVLEAVGIDHRQFSWKELRHTTASLMHRKGVPALVIKDQLRHTNVKTTVDFYIGSDVFFTFLVNNDLFRLRLHLTCNSATSHEEFQEIEQRFLSGRFPATIQEQFRAMLDYYGQAPIIVRSSSLLEDSFGNAFAGKYRSIFCANQGNPEARLADFMQAVKLVYASALNPDALSYRSKRGLGEYDEQMAILVQRVSGMPYRHYFFPTLAGVAFSQNLYAWNDSIDTRQGIIRLVFGLGTRAVERVGSDYPRMIAISHPNLRPEVGVKISKYSQHHVDLLDLKTNQFDSHFLADLLVDGEYPNLHLFVSVMRDNNPYDPISAKIEGEVGQWVLTFNNLLRRTDFVPLIGSILAKLEEAYGQPVDIEFTASVDAGERVRINLVQCRPLFTPGSLTDVLVPTSLERQQILFRAHRMICGGSVDRIHYILYIDPQHYNHLEPEAKKTLGRLVGQINRHPAIQGNKMIIMGPGRWGSSNIALGVNVSYADIDNSAVLVEMALEEAGHVPEVSYGTHFSHDLVEAQIIYLPVYPDDDASEFQKTFFENAPSVLSELLPHANDYESVLRLIDVPKTTGGAFAKVVADPQRHQAVCFLDKSTTRY